MFLAFTIPLLKDQSEKQLVSTFYGFDYWNLKEWKAAKVKNYSVSAYFLFTQMIGSLFNMFTCAFFFFCEIPKYVQAKNRLTLLSWDFMEVG